MSINDSQFSIACTGDVCKGDEILFVEAVFGGTFRRPSHLGDRKIVAVITADHYGTGKYQHTVSLRVIDSEGYQPLAPDKRILRKARNVYRHGTKRKPRNEEVRNAELADKHERGDEARKKRDYRGSKYS